MYYYILFFLKEIKNYIITLFDQINLLIKEIKDKEFKSFLSENKKLFDKFYSDKNFKDDSLILSTTFIHHPGYQITQMIIGKYLEKILGNKAIGIQEQNSIFLNKLFKSYGYDEVYIFKKNNIFKRLKMFARSKKILSDLKNFDNLINYEVDKVKIGKIVYEHYIRFTGHPSLNKFNFKINYFLYKALEYHEYSKEFFKKNKIKYVLISEKQFMPSSIIFQNALLNKGKIFARVAGPNNVGLRLYNDESEFYKSRYHFSNEILNDIYKNHLNKVIIYADKILKNRFSNSKNKDIQDVKNADIAFKKKEEFTKKSLCHRLNWDEKKPIVIIFDQHYLDGIYDSERLYFKDTLDWIASTFKEIKKIKNVNWLIKDHPLDPNEHHHAKTTTEKEFKKIIGEIEHIKLFPNDYSAGLLPQIASAIITSFGTVGIEYPCFGIPCILSNTSHYSGNGFTIEPQTKEEYFKYLNNITNLKKLNSEEIGKAKTFLFLEIIFGRVPMPLIPNYDITHNFFLKDNSKKFWKKCAELVSNYNVENDKFMNNLEKQIKSNKKHLVNNNIINYY